MYQATIQFPVEITEDEYENFKVQSGVGSLDDSQRARTFAYREIAYAKCRKFVESALPQCALTDTSLEEM